MSQSYPFELKPLPYSYEALEPYIDSTTMHIHHEKHVQTYVDNLNGVLKQHPEYQSWSLEKLVKEVGSLPKEIQGPVRNNAGGVSNHNFYFANMTPDSSKAPVKELKEAIDKKFTSFENFKDEFRKAALGRFGSGWAWLVVNANKELEIVSTPNQDSVLESGYVPVVAIDVWEHAYYLKYQNKRADYVGQWFEVVNWEEANKNYTEAL